MISKDNCKHILVITTVHKPDHIMKQIVAGAFTHGWQIVIVGDTRTPEDYSLEGTEYLSIIDQLKSIFRLAKLLPVCHYSRKNIGYLYAIQNGADVIVETDDDNLPLDEFWCPRTRVNKVNKLRGNHWINVYKIFTSDDIWPRGLPLNVNHLKNCQVEEEIEQLDCCIQQGLADSDPDVDAIYRLSIGKQCFFDKRTPVVLSGDQRCPFNSQNTTWWPEAWELLYLPSFCSNRVADIWRSFVAQSYLLRNGYVIEFHNSTVIQERNEHDLELDFSEEIPGYLYNRKIMTILDKIQYDCSPSEFLIKAYTILADYGFVNSQEISLVRAWTEDFQKALIKSNSY